jgi:hypothetical protein
MKKKSEVVVEQEIETAPCCAACSRVDWALEAATWAEFLDRVKTLTPGEREDRRISKRIALIVDRVAPPA